MAAFVAGALCRNSRRFIKSRNCDFSRTRGFCSQTPEEQNGKDEEFRVLTLYPTKVTERTAKSRITYEQCAPPREMKMPVDQDWPSVWPAASSFRPSVVPLPVYQGYVEKKAPPGKYGNAELMKIPNFLHLTPPAIKRQCAAIKKFCTKWPEALDSDEKCDEHFPLEVVITNYCHSSPTIRDERSRIVTFKVKLPSLNLDYHASDKMRRLVGEQRWDAENNTLILVADRCPLRQQNYDYLMYVLAALYRESQITEPWEQEKTEADMEKFFFEGSRHQKHIVETVAKIMKAKGKSQDLNSDEIKKQSDIVSYGDCVTEIINEGESAYSIHNYKACVSKILGFPASGAIESCTIAQ